VRADLALIIIACAILGATIGVARTPLSAAKVKGYTALWIAPAGRPGKPAVKTTIASVERRPVAYTLVVSVGGTPQRRIGPFRLKPGEERTLSIPVHAAARHFKVETLLYRASRPRDVYRRTSVWLGPR
jgi:hypothetical protein